MKQFEVTFTIYRQKEPGKAMISSSRTSGLKTKIHATDMGQARAMIEAQYGKNCSVHGIRPL